jgi:6-pyruvoyltetrahydropterin/6-carboxytetrahydropterin synthase
MRLNVCKEFTFAAAHSLPGYDGPCANLHGHEWKLEVEVSGVVNEDTGMVLDFVKLKKIVNQELVDKLDHKHLNDIFVVIPTAEMMVGNFADIINHVFNNEKKGLGVKLERLRLYETPTSFCEWKRSSCSC